MSENLFKNPKGFVCGYCGIWFSTVKSLALHKCPEARKEAQHVKDKVRLHT